MFDQGREQKVPCCEPVCNTLRFCDTSEVIEFNQTTNQIVRVSLQPTSFSPTSTVHRFDGEEGLPPEQGGPGTFPADELDDLGRQFREQIQSLFGSRRGRLMIDTWFLHASDQPTCDHARRIQVFRDDNGARFVRDLLTTWGDHLSFGTVSIRTIRSPVPGMPTTVADVVLCQAFDPWDRAYLVTAGFFTFANSKRAVIGHEITRGVDLFMRLGHPISVEHDMHGTLESISDGAIVHNDEVIWFPDGAFIHAAIYHAPRLVAYDTDSEEDSQTSQCDTATPSHRFSDVSEQDSDDDVDPVSFFSLQSDTIIRALESSWPLDSGIVVESQRNITLEDAAYPQVCFDFHSTDAILPALSDSASTCDPTDDEVCTDCDDMRDWDAVVTQLHAGLDLPPPTLLTQGPEEDSISMMETSRSTVAAPSASSAGPSHVGHSMTEPTDLMDEMNEPEVLIPQWLELIDLTRPWVRSTASPRQPLLLVTFGVNLVSLGRRDTHIFDLDCLAPQVRRLWQDFLHLGQLQIFIVDPQPDVGLRSPHLVLLVSILTPQQWFPAPSPAVLVIQEADDPTLVAIQPFAERLPIHLRRSELLERLRLQHLTYPHSIRSVTVTCRGDRLDDTHVQRLRDGDLVTVSLGPMPLATVTLAQHIANAERLHLATDQLQRSGMLFQEFVTCHFHGISPSNRPLEFRVLPFQLAGLYDLAWLEQVRELWPFHGITATVAYVGLSVNPDEPHNIRATILNFIVSYDANPRDSPVLVHQTMVTANMDHSHAQHWAVRIPVRAGHDAIEERLRSPPFWIYPDVPLVLQHENHIVTEELRTWYSGDLLQFRTVVLDQEEMMDVLIEGAPRHPDAGELEYMSLIQIQAIAKHATPLTDLCAEWRSKLPDPAPPQVAQPHQLLWNEIPHQFCLDDIFGSLQCPWFENHLCDHDAHVSEKPGLQDLEPEGNSGLRRVSLRSEPCEVRHVSLANSIPSPVWVFVDVARPLFLWHQVTSGEWRAPCTNWHGFQWHPSTQHMLDVAELWDGSTPSHIQFYTDGSFCRDTKTAFAAAVMVVWIENTWYFGGFRVFRVWDPPSSLRAERIGLLGALVWAIQLSVKWTWAPVQFEFCFDSTVAGFTTNGTWQSPGDPWNEAADYACSFGRNDLIYLHDLEPVFNLMTFDHSDDCSHQWMWIFACPDSHWHSHVDGTRLKFNIAQPASSLPDPTALSMTAASADMPRAIETMHSLKCFSANVMTLFPTGDRTGTFHSSRAESLARQFMDEQAFMIGIQESRSQASGHSLLLDFHVVAAPATAKGHYGVQLWVRRSLQTENGRLDIAHEHLSVVHEDPRRLFIKMDTGSLRFFILVLHAPPGTDEAASQEWWNHTTSLIPSWTKSWPWIVLADANGRLGEWTSEAVGPCGAENETPGLEEVLCINGCCPMPCLPLKHGLNTMSGRLAKPLLKANSAWLSTIGLSSALISLIDVPVQIVRAKCSKIVSLP
eukprot:Skav222184  [mRNA]  locus=scaffold3784:87184:92084:+ [translate_table: standard]